MFALFINPQTQAPTTVSMNSRHYLELQMAGYTEILKGSKRNLLDKEKELADELGLRDLGEIEND